MARILVNLLSYSGGKGGTETYTRELYREFGTMNTEHEFIGLACTEFMTKDFSWFPGQVIPSKISGENRWQWALGELFAVSRAANRAHADLIHSPANLGPWRSQIPSVYTVHDMLYYRAPELMATPFFTEPVKWMERRLAGNATRIITDSEASSLDIQKYLDFPREAIDVIFLAGTAPTTAPETGIQREPDLFLAMGTRSPHKNFEGLVRAIAEIPVEQRPRLVITGSRGDDPLRPLVEKLGVSQWVDLRSWVPKDELDWLYAHATALMIASFADGFGLPILDAMHVGLPVLASSIPPYREVAGDAAGFFDPTDPGDIARVMLKAVNDPQWLGELVVLGRANTSKYTWRKTAELTLESFGRALEGPLHAK